MTDKPTFRELCFRFGLAWSNREVEDEVLLNIALLKPHFDIILAAAKEFGIEKLLSSWDKVQKACPDEAAYARPHTERMLTNIERAIEKVRAERAAGSPGESGSGVLNNSRHC
ncbi:hypothetical protein EDC30_103226 [Paucimonas lemoignei]|uniref:Uncharacterized protein n=1 Tax=Paucimonas lemoignei TaxID=29443 RepID=A0A4R3HYJ7_PAULE|nr:hypothetical protein [Paucimonas lemoignei]TCS37934.1 hypothetical protein EDC30_103226 [Paucimonas lemoignei]